MSSLTESLANSTVDSVTTLLAKCAHEMQKVRQMRKAAESDLLGSIASTLKNSPGLQASLAGAGIGAGVGGLTALGSEKQRKHVLRNALTGALAGGAIGGGGYMAARSLPKTLFPATGENSKPLPTITDKPTLDRIQELQNRSTAGSLASGAVDTALEYPRRHPFLSMLGMADVGSHTANAAQRLAQKDKLVIPEHSSVLDSLRRGADKLSKGVVGGDKKKGPDGPVSKELLNIIQGGGGGVKSVNGVRFSGKDEGFNKLLNDAVTRARTGGKQTVFKMHDPKGTPAPAQGAAADVKLPEELEHTLTARNIQSIIDAHEGKYWRPLGTESMGTAGKWLHEKGMPRIPGMATRLGGLSRLGIYAGIPAAEMLWREASSDRAKQRELLNLIQGLSKPAG